MVTATSDRSLSHRMIYYRFKCNVTANAIVTVTTRSGCGRGMVKGESAMNEYTIQICASQIKRKRNTNSEAIIMHRWANKSEKHSYLTETENNIDIPLAKKRKKRGQRREMCKKEKFTCSTVLSVHCPNPMNYIDRRRQGLKSTHNTKYWTKFFSLLSFLGQTFYDPSCSAAVVA